MSIRIKRIKEVLTVEAREDFEKFIKGQPGTIDKNGYFMVPDDDLLRWLKRKPVID